MKKQVYHVNCNCSSYDWERYPPKSGVFPRCRYCRRQLGDFQFSRRDNPFRIPIPKHIK